MSIALTERSAALRDRPEGSGREHGGCCRFLLVGERGGRPLFRCEMCLRYYDGRPEPGRLDFSGAGG